LLPVDESHPSAGNLNSSIFSPLGKLARISLLSLPLKLIPTISVGERNAKVPASSLFVA
jgi:hypothetical protein